MSTNRIFSLSDWIRRVLNSCWFEWFFLFYTHCSWFPQDVLRSTDCAVEMCELRSLLDIPLMINTSKLNEIIINNTSWYESVIVNCWSHKIVFELILLNELWYGRLEWCGCWWECTRITGESTNQIIFKMKMKTCMKFKIRFYLIAVRVYEWQLCMLELSVFFHSNSLPLKLNGIQLTTLLRGKYIWLCKFHKANQRTSLFIWVNICWNSEDLSVSLMIAC